MTTNDSPAITKPLKELEEMEKLRKNQKCPVCGRVLKLYGFNYVKCPVGHSMPIEAAEMLLSLSSRLEKLENALRECAKSPGSCRRIVSQVLPPLP